MDKITDKVLQKIKKEKLEPKPRWQFLLRDGGRWLIFASMVIVAILAVSLLIYFWSDGPWLHGRGLGFGSMFGRMPLLFLFLILIGSLFALFDFRSTGRGYRWPLAATAAVLAVAVLLIGGLANYFGLSRGLDSAISRAPYYQPQAQYMMSVWQNPGEGRLTGEIVAVESKTNFSLRDFTGKTWAVSSLNAIWRHNLEPEAGLRIKMLGSQLGRNGFEATDIRPFMPNGGNCAMMQPQGSCGMMR